MKQYDLSCYIHSLTIFFSVISFPWLQAYGLSNETDRLALLQFKQGIINDPHGSLNSWNASNHFCNWFGVSCGPQHQRVVSLDLQGQDLNGILSPYVGNMSFLRILNLQNNSLYGQIPSEIGNLFRLQQLTLGNNSFEGEIPANLSRCFELRRIILQYNNLSGEIPPRLGGLTNLEVFALANNNLIGGIPVSFGNLSSLVFFLVGSNNLVGNIPDELGRLKNLNYFNVADNRLSGVIPPSLLNISSLFGFMLSVNQFEGNLPQNIGLTLPNIQDFGVAENLLSGSIPDSFSNATGITMIDIVGNKFSGQVPNTLGSLKNLFWLNLGVNNLVNENDWSFLASLTNCTSLAMLELSFNNFSGALPNSIGNFSSQLGELYLDNNQITGSIPTTIENLANLIALDFHNNLLIGFIPSNLDTLQNLQTLSFSENRLSGPIPSSIGNLSNLFEVDLSHNILEGSIPDSIKNCTSLQNLVLSHNLLNGSIPILLPSFLNILNLSRNFLTGHLPEEIGAVGSLNLIDVSENRLSGEIPRSIGKCLGLETLSLQGNSFQGKIPASFSSLRGLQNLDLSRNNLTGEIPPYLQNISSAQFFNLSFNNFEGEVPKTGVFSNVSLFSVAGNKKICDGLPELGLPKCFTESARKEKHHVVKLAAIASSIALLVFLVAVILVIHHRRKQSKHVAIPSLLTDPRIEVSYRDLHQATGGFSSYNLIGSGSFGLVYKGFLNQAERYVAIKVLKLEVKEASKSFMAECKALRSVRHRNLVKLLTYCSSLDYAGNDFKALIFEFMENGSLEKWLDRDQNIENQPKSLTFLQRLNITIDVASALHYLHDLCEGPIIHCDLKPSNILLDDSFVAHISDFGLAKLFFTINDGSQSQISSIGLKGTIGYAPPEYGLGGMASKEGDVYSFGILVLELFSGKKPTHEMFKKGLDLHDFVKNGLAQALWEVMDPTLLSGGTEKDARTTAETSYTGCNGNLTGNQKESIISVFKVGLACSTHKPKERQKMGDVVKELHLIKSTFLGVRIYG